MSELSSIIAIIVGLLGMGGVVWFARGRVDESKQKVKEHEKALVVATERERRRKIVDEEIAKIETNHPTENPADLAGAILDLVGMLEGDSIDGNGNDRDGDS